jgi:hypothetical protein
MKGWQLRSSMPKTEMMPTEPGCVHKATFYNSGPESHIG